MSDFSRSSWAIVAGFVLLFSVQPAGAQQAVWEHTGLKDPLTEKTVDRFVLTGEYLVPPVPAPPAGLAVALGISTSSLNDPPRLVLSCSEGKLVRKYGIVRGVPGMPTPASLGLPGAPRGSPMKIDLVVDGGKKKTVSSTVVVNTDRPLADQPAAPSVFELDNVLSDVLRGKTLTMVLRPDTSNMLSIGGTLRQVLVEFSIPDPSPILAACNNEKSLRGGRP